MREVVLLMTTSRQSRDLSIVMDNRNSLDLSHIDDEQNVNFLANSTTCKLITKITLGHAAVAIVSSLCMCTSISLNYRDWPID